MSISISITLNLIAYSNDKHSHATQWKEILRFFYVIQLHSYGIFCIGLAYPGVIRERCIHVRGIHAYYNRLLISAIYVIHFKQQFQIYSPNCEKSIKI